MSELTLMVLRLGFLVLLWLFVFSVLFALRSDLFGAPVRRLKNLTSTNGASGGTSGGAAVITSPAPPTPSASRPPSDATPGSGGPPKYLHILTGVAEGSSIPLDEDLLTIGRSPDSTLVIVDEYTSTYHARLQQSRGAWTIIDLDSTNGTKVNGSRITEPTPLPTFTPVTIGTTTFELRP